MDNLVKTLTALLITFIIDAIIRKELKTRYIPREESHTIIISERFNQIKDTIKKDTINGITEKK